MKYLKKQKKNYLSDLNIKNGFCLDFSGVLSLFLGETTYYPIKLWCNLWLLSTCPNQGSKTDDVTSDEEHHGPLIYTGYVINQLVIKTSEFSSFSSLLLFLT